MESAHQCPLLMLAGLGPSEVDIMATETSEASCQQSVSSPRRALNETPRRHSFEGSWPWQVIKPPRVSLRSQWGFGSAVVSLPCLHGVVTHPHPRDSLPSAHGPCSYCANSGSLRDKVSATPELWTKGWAAGVGGMREQSKLRLGRTAGAVCLRAQVLGCTGSLRRRCRRAHCGHPSRCLAVAPSIAWS